jgi:hypothetical protein
MDSSKRLKLVEEIMETVRIRQSADTELKVAAETILLRLNENDPAGFKFYTADQELMRKSRDEVKRLVFASLFASDMTDEHLGEVLAFMKSEAGTKWCAARFAGHQMATVKLREYGEAVGIHFAGLLHNRVFKMLLSAIRTIKPDLNFRDAVDLTGKLMSETSILPNLVTPENVQMTTEEVMKMWEEVEEDRKIRPEVPHPVIVALDQFMQEMHTSIMGQIIAAVTESEQGPLPPAPPIQPKPKQTH